MPSTIVERLKNGMEELKKKKEKRRRDSSSVQIQLRPPWLAQTNIAHFLHKGPQVFGQSLNLCTSTDNFESIGHDVTQMQTSSFNSRALTYFICIKYFGIKLISFFLFLSFKKTHTHWYKITFLICYL